MKTISVSDLKAHLSEQIRSIKRGSRVLITERGKPVAELGPPISSPSLRLSELQASGVVRLGTGVLPGDFWDRDRPQDPEGGVRKALLREREGGR